MKILFVTRDKFPPFRPAAAAIFKVELVQRGHDIDWVLQAADPGPSRTETIDGGTVYLGANGGGGGLVKRVFAKVRDLGNYFRVFGLIRKHRYDIVQAKDHYLPALITLMACKWYGVPFCYWLAYPHAEGSIYKSQKGMTRFRWYYLIRGHFWKFLLYKILLPSSRHIFVQSEQMARDLAEEGVPMEKMTPVPGSVELANIPYQSTGPSVSQAESMGDNAVVYLGTLARVRQLDFLLEAFQVVTQTHPEATLFMLGKGDEPQDEDFLVAEAERLGIADRVVFTGYLPMEQGWEYIRRAAVCVSPYFPTMILNSTSPTKLIEYMAMARPTVGNDHPEQKLVLEQSGAGLAVPWEPAAFGDAISTILSDPERGQEMGRNGRAFVEEHRTNAVMTDVVEAQYLRIVGS